MYKKILFIAIIFYIVFFSWFCFWKYSNFGYNGLDLAIYNQVFFNSAHGQLFHFTIHPQSYLGDHFEIFIFMLLPFYYFFQSPLTLLFLQTIFLAICAWPLFLIAKRLINEKIALFVALLWLINPFVHNINLFEFHLLPFAIFFIFWAIYFYQKEKIWPFLIFIFLALLVREDVALVTILFGGLALIEKRKLTWVLAPIIISGTWFILALKISGLFSNSGHYKFLYYYSWLGANYGEIIKNVFLKPLLIINHLANWQNFLFIFGLLMPGGYLVIFQPKYLLLAILPALQILLASDSSLVALETHYTALFLPPLFLALIYELKKIIENYNLNKLEKWLRQEKLLLFGIILVIAFYSALTLGPVLGIFQTNFNQPEIKQKKQLIKSLSADDKLATTFDFLTPLSSRQYLYSLHYAFLGKEQFSEKIYQLPRDVNKILADTSEFIIYPFIFPEQQDQQGFKKIRDYLETNNFQATVADDSYVLWQTNAQQNVSLYQINPSIKEISEIKNYQLTDNLQLVGWTGQLIANRLPLSLYFKTQNKITENYQLRLVVQGQNDQPLYQKDYALAYGLLPTSDWPAGSIIKINYNFLLPDYLTLAQSKIVFQLISQKGFLTLNRIRQVVPSIIEEKIIAEFNFLPDK